MRDRWIGARRQEGRRRLRLVVALAVAVALVGAAFAVSRSPLLAVRTVEVVGAEHETAAEVAAVAGLASHPAMLSLDPAALARRIETLPWVASARVSRRWPSTVTVEVSERTAVGVAAESWAGGATYAAVAAGSPVVLVDGTGRVLGTAAGTVPGLPVLLAPTTPGPAGQWLAGTTPGAVSSGTATPLDALLDLAAELPPSLSASVAYLEIGAGGQLQGAVDVPAAVPGPQASGGKTTTRSDTLVPVNFGDSTGFPGKISALQTLMAQVDLSYVTAIDVSDSQHPYLTGNPQPASVSTTAGG
jgi:hypothetical protein